MSTRQRILSFLLLITLLPILQIPVTGEAADPSRAMEDAMDLMIAAHGILLEEDVDPDAFLPGGAVRFSIRTDVPPNSPADQILVRLINATKRELGDIERACREILNSFVEPGQECEKQLSNAFCTQRQEQLRQRLSFLRKVRGDRRKALTRAWHSIKRAVANLWRNLGPLGRRFLRELGSDALSVIQSGGSLHGGVLRNLIIKRARSTIQRTAEGILTRALQRKVLGQAARASACDGEDESQMLSEDIKDCGDEEWFDQAWEDSELLLLAEGRNCQSAAIYIFQECMFEQAASGACQDEAAAACQDLYDAIPLNLPAAGATFKGETIYGGAVRNEVTVNLPGSDGEASGHFYYELYDDVLICTIKTTAEATGVFSPENCTVSGTANLVINYDGMICASVCGNAPSSPAPCPLTISGAVPWQAELENNQLIGAIGDESCDPHCFGFSANR